MQCKAQQVDSRPAATTTEQDSHCFCCCRHPAAAVVGLEAEVELPRLLTELQGLAGQALFDKYVLLMLCLT